MRARADRLVEATVEFSTVELNASEKPSATCESFIEVIAPKGDKRVGKRLTVTGETGTGIAWELDDCSVIIKDDEGELWRWCEGSGPPPLKPATPISTKKGEVDLPNSPDPLDQLATPLGDLPKATKLKSTDTGSDLAIPSNNRIAALSTDRLAKQNPRSKSGSKESVASDKRASRRASSRSSTGESFFPGKNENDNLGYNQPRFSRILQSVGSTPNLRNPMGSKSGSKESLASASSRASSRSSTRESFWPGKNENDSIGYNQTRSSGTLQRIGSTLMASNLTHEKGNLTPSPTPSFIKDDAPLERFDFILF